MKKTFTIISFVSALVLLLSLTSCSSLKITDEMQVGMDKYIEAVKNSQARTSGTVNVTSVAVDAAINFKTTESVINCDYSITDGKVSYTRSDYLDGTQNAQYRCDGEKVESCDLETGEWSDKTEDNAAFMSADTNPLTTLSLFRVDSKYKIRTDYMTDIIYNSVPDEDGLTSVEFTLKDSTVSDVLDYSKVKGIVRKSAGHTRTYYIGADGCISKIIVSTNQIIYSNGKEGSYTTQMTVLCS